MQKIIVSIFLLTLLVFSADAQKRRTKRTRAAKPKVIYITREAPPAPVEPQAVVTEKAIAVNASSYKTLQIYVENFKRIVGRFEATGGGRNDIELLILDADGLTNFQNGNNFKSYYRSGSVTVENFDVSLAGSKIYYLVFQNRYWFGGKAVTIHLEEYGN